MIHTPTLVLRVSHISLLTLGVLRVAAPQQYLPTLAGWVCAYGNRMLMSTFRCLSGLVCSFR